MLALLFGASLFWMVTWHDGSGGRVVCTSGRVAVVKFDLQLIAAQNPGRREPPTPYGFSCQRLPVHANWLPQCTSLGAPPTFRAIVVPLWIPFAVAAVPTGLLWRAELRRRSRALSTLCLSCGYDRQGLAPDAMCPECGQVPTK
jgi:hypothetical protein